MLLLVLKHNLKRFVGKKIVLTKLSSQLKLSKNNMFECVFSVGGDILRHSYELREHSLNAVQFHYSLDRSMA